MGNESANEPGQEIIEPRVRLRDGEMPAMARMNTVKAVFRDASIDELPPLELHALQQAAGLLLTTGVIHSDVLVEQMSTDPPARLKRNRRDPSKDDAVSAIRSLKEKGFLVFDEKHMRFDLSLPSNSGGT